MSRILFAASALSLAFIAPAHADERQFTKDGVTYTYSTETSGDTRIVRGSASQGARFKLVVKNGWVRGYFGGTKVSFPAKQEETVTVASR